MAETMTTSQDATRWTCEQCGGSRVVRSERGAGIVAVVQRIQADHHAYAPSCVTDLARITVSLAALTRTGDAA